MNRRDSSHSAFQTFGLGRFEDNDDERLGELLRNLVSSDDAIIPALRTAIDRGKHKRLSVILDTFIESKMKELKNLCNVHFGEFSDGVQIVMGLRKKAARLRSMLESINDSVESKGNTALSTSDQLIRTCQFQRRLSQAMEKIKQAKVVLYFVGKAEEQVNSGAYLQAIQTVDLVCATIQGEGVSLSEYLSEMNFLYDSIASFEKNKEPSFYSEVENWIPRIVSRIVKNVSKNLTDWLLDAHKKTDVIGAAGFKAFGTNLKLPLLTFTEKGADHSQIIKLCGILLKKVGPNSIQNDKEEKHSRDECISFFEDLWIESNLSREGIIESCVREHLSLSRVVEFMNIRQWLGEREAAEEFYRTNRRAQMDMHTFIYKKPAHVKPKEFLRSFCSLLEKATGFFMIESRLTRNFNLISLRELSEVWNNLTLEVLTPFRSVLLVDSDVDRSDFLRAIQRLYLLTHLLGLRVDSAQLEGYEQRNKDSGLSEGKDAPAIKADTANVDFDDNRKMDFGALLSLCIDEREAIFDKLVAFSSSDVRSLVSNDNCQPLVIKFSGDEHHDVLSALALLNCEDEKAVSKSNADENSIFPMCLSFSAVVPQFLKILLSLLYETFCTAAMLGGNVRIKDIRQFLRKSTRTVSSKTKSESRASFVTSTNILPLFSALVARNNAAALITRLAAVVGELVENPAVSIEQICQHSCNLKFIKNTRGGLETLVHYIGKLSSETDSKSFRLSFDEFESLDGAINRAEEAVYHRIGEKVSDLLSACDNENFAPETPSNGVSNFVNDLVHFLDSTFAEHSCLCLISASYRDAILFSCCSQASETFFEILCGKSVKSINVFGIHTLRLDLNRILNFVDQQGKEGLLECFTQTMQLLALLGDGEVENYLNPVVRGQKYSYVSPAVARKALAKYQVTERVKNVPDTVRLMKSTEVKNVLKALSKS